MRICPLALMSGNTYYCNSSCALSSGGKCLLVTALKGYINEKHVAIATYPNEATGKDSHSDYWEQFSSKKESKIQSRFPHDDWDNPTCGWETWGTQDDPVLSSNREYRENLKEEGF